MADTGERSPDERWSNEFLDSMRQVGDTEADGVIRTLFQQGDVDAVNSLMATLVRNDGLPSALLPEVVRDYLADNARITFDDTAQIARAQNLFALNGPEMLVALGFYSLPASYAAKKGVQVLYRTAFLKDRPVRRVFETTQMVIDVLTPSGLAAGGRGRVTVDKVRLMHAAVRHLLLTDRALPWDTASLGYPVNQEDLAGTLMTFSYLVLDGLHRLGIDVPSEDQEAYLAFWVSLARLLGLRSELYPRNVSEARALTDIIYTRQIAPSMEGVQLTRALLDGMEGLIPIQHLKSLPAALVQFFLAKDAIGGQNVAALLQVPEEKLPLLAVRILGELGEISQRFGSDAIGSVIRFFSGHFLQGMLDVSRGGARSPFFIPDALKERWGMPGNN
ncbi:MAG TPA: oxygenase MpaB family protein [Polyangiaceae bacterium]|nr:oxygenase MpaB family protein [Polyangiaceae bacterium]